MKKPVNEDEVPVNNASAGNVASFDPLLAKKRRQKSIDKFKNFVKSYIVSRLNNK